MRKKLLLKRPARVVDVLTPPDVPEEVQKAAATVLQRAPEIQCTHVDRQTSRLIGRPDLRYKYT